jgi:trk system potassium uptake protein TrkA
VYIVIVGGGRVGYYLAKALLDEGHEVLIVEKSAVVSDAINDDLGSVCIRGDGCEASVLNQIGTGRADFFVAVTGDDEDNLISCQVAKHKFKVPRTIARVRNPRNEGLFRVLGIDVAISATNLILEQIAEEVPTHPLVHLLAIRDRGLEIVDLRITHEAPSIGKAIKDIKLPQNTLLLLLVRKGQQPLIPEGSIILAADDQVIAVIDPRQEADLRKAFQGG